MLLTIIVAFVASTVGTRLFIDWLAARQLVAVAARGRRLPLARQDRS